MGIGILGWLVEKKFNMVLKSASGEFELQEERLYFCGGNLIWYHSQVVSMLKCAHSESRGEC